MDERTAQPEGRSEVPSHPQETPPLPPSPLAQVEPEIPPDVPLAWSTVPRASLAGLTGGACQGVILHCFYFTAYIRAAEAAFHMATVGALGAALLALGAVGADHYASGLSRPLRWGGGMALGAVFPVAQWFMFGAMGAIGGGRFVMPPFIVRDWVFGLVVGAVLGLLLGAASRSGQGLLWKLPLVALVPVGVLAANRASSLIGLWAYLSSMRAHAFIDYFGGGLTLLPFCAAWPLAALFGLALAERLNAARRRVVE